MPEQEARDDEREEAIEAATHRLIDWDTDVADRGVSEEHYRERRADVERIFDIIAGYRKHPEPEITEARVEAAWVAYRGAMRDGLDFRPGIRAALEAAFRVPVGEVEQP